MSLLWHSFHSGEKSIRYRSSVVSFPQKIIFSWTRWSNPRSRGLSHMLQENVFFCFLPLKLLNHLQNEAFNKCNCNSYSSVFNLLWWMVISTFKKCLRICYIFCLRSSRKISCLYFPTYFSIQLLMNLFIGHIFKLCKVI